MPKTRLNHDAFGRILQELIEGPCTVAELVDITGLHFITMQRLTHTLYKMKVIHVAAWEKDCKNRWSIRAYALGHGKDKPKPKPTPRHVRRLSWPSRHKGSAMEQVVQCLQQ
jgi:hypothetical protein